MQFIDSNWISKIIMKIKQKISNINNEKICVVFFSHLVLQANRKM